MTHGGVRQTLSVLKDGAGANDMRSVLWLVKMLTAMSYLATVGLAAHSDDESMMQSLRAAFEAVRDRLG